MSLDGLLVDFGGVLTSDVFASFEAFCRQEGLEPDAVKQRFMGDPEARGLLFELELGNLTVEEFEPRFAAVLGVDPSGLVEGLFGGMSPDVAMLEGVAAAKRAGKRTGLVSNSWGADTYDRSRFSELFDAVVISGEEGMRKPDPEIYALAVERIGLPAERCVFVDDLPGNLKPARAMGITTVLHRGEATDTLAELEGLLGVTLR